MKSFFKFSLLFALIIAGRFTKAVAPTAAAKQVQTAAKSVSPFLLVQDLTTPRPTAQRTGRRKQAQPVSRPVSTIVYE